MAEAIDHRYEGDGHRWRVQSGDDGAFDEVVVSIGGSTAGLVLHAEMMDDRDCFIDVAGLCLWVHVVDDGVARITHQEDRRRPFQLSDT